jgi:hypothetical protein
MKQRVVSITQQLGPSFDQIVELEDGSQFVATPKHFMENGDEVEVMPDGSVSHWHSELGADGFCLFKPEWLQIPQLTAGSAQRRTRTAAVTDHLNVLPGVRIKDDGGATGHIEFPGLSHEEVHEALPVGCRIEIGSSAGSTVEGSTITVVYRQDIRRIP